jgi:hypothetical protein
MLYHCSNTGPFSPIIVRNIQRHNIIQSRTAQSLNHSLIKSSNHQIIQSSNHPIIKSSNHPIIKSPNLVNLLNFKDKCCFHDQQNNVELLQDKFDESDDLICSELRIRLVEWHYGKQSRMIYERNRVEFTTETDYSVCSITVIGDW